MNYRKNQSSCREASDDFGDDDDVRRSPSLRQARDNSMEDYKLAHEDQKIHSRFDVPFGCAKSPFSTPDLIALLNWVSKTASEDARFLWLALRYFLREGRLCVTIGLARSPSKITRAKK